VRRTPLSHDRGEYVTHAVTRRKANVGTIVLALLMLLFVARMVFQGYYVVLEWQSESALLTACGVYGSWQHRQQSSARYGCLDRVAIVAKP
jgi:hypothetical protein